MKKEVCHLTKYEPVSQFSKKSQFFGSVPLEQTCKLLKERNNQILLNSNISRFSNSYMIVHTRN